MPRNDDLYGPALAAAHRALRAEPKLLAICRLTRGGVLKHSWTQDPAVSDYLDGIKPHRQAEAATRLLGKAHERMEAEQALLFQREAETLASPAFADLSALPQRMASFLFKLSHDPVKGGPDVLATNLSLVGSLYQMYGTRYSSRAISWAAKKLQEAGILTYTPGVAWEGFQAARGNVYHLLPDGYFVSPTSGTGNRAYEVGPPDSAYLKDMAQVHRVFDACVERLRSLKYLYMHEGRAICDEDMYFDGPVRKKPSPWTGMELAA